VQAAGLTLANRLPKEAGRFPAGGLKRDDARNRQQTARVLLSAEALKPARQQQNGQNIVRGLGHRAGGPDTPGSPVLGAASSRPPGIWSPALSGLSGERVAAAISATSTFIGW